jgi:ABC-type transporter Mla maintaining outer membrane lipid asymmetry ATPase subunit MlaF
MNDHVLPTGSPLEFRDIPVTGSAVGLLTLKVRQHETVVVVGDENSGVDSLAAIALGLEHLTSGIALVYGTSIHGLARIEQLAFRRRLGYLPAGDGLLSNLSLRDNIRLPLRFGSNFKQDEIEGRVDVILAMLRLTRVARERPAQANEEQRRRAALGRALAFDPDLVLLEQPFVAMTDRVSAELLEIARGGETSEGGRRTVFITGQDIPMLLRTRVERVVQVAETRRPSHA